METNEEENAAMAKRMETMEVFMKSVGAVASVNADAANSGNAGAGGTGVTNEQSVANGMDVDENSLKLLYTC